MKLIYAIIRNDNEDDVIQALMQEHFVVTRLSTTGGFLKKGGDIDRMRLRASRQAQRFGTAMSSQGLREADEAVISVVVNIVPPVHIRLPQAFKQP